MPKTPRGPTGPIHLAASLRVVSSHLNMRHATVAAARDQVLEVAQRAKAGDMTPELEALQARLEKVTGVPLAELAQHAEGWVG